MKDRIKLIRKEAGLNQSEFADSLGLSRSMIAQIEIDQNKLSDRSIRDICRIYKVNEVWLRTGEGDMRAPLSRNEELASFFNDVLAEEPDSVRRIWIDCFSKLPYEAWVALDNLAEEYIKNKKG